MLRAAAFTAAILCLAAPARAGEVTIEFQDGYVTLMARDASARQILQEWARAGNTRIVNLDKLHGAPVTLELTRVPEKQAIEVVLRSAAGYLAAPRPADAQGASRFSQIHVMPPSVAPPPRPQTGTRARRPPIFNPQPPPVMVDDQGNPVPNYGGVMGGEEGQPDPALMPAAPVEEGGTDADPGVVAPMPYPGVQPYVPAAGDPPPPDQEPAEVVEEPQAVAPGPMPGQGSVVAPMPGQLPLPDPQERRPRR